MNEEKIAKIFYVYSNKDKNELNTLISHLSILEKNRKCIFWYQDLIEVGSNRLSIFKENLKASDIIILLISANFLSSTTCFDIAMEQALKMANKGKAIVIPILIKNCLFEETPLSKLQFLPRNKQPVNSKNWNNRDEPYLIIAKELRKIVEKINLTKGQSKPKTLILKKIMNPFDAFKKKLKKIANIKSPQYFANDGPAVAAEVVSVIFQQLLKDNNDDNWVKIYSKNLNGQIGQREQVFTNLLKYIIENNGTLNVLLKEKPNLEKQEISSYSLLKKYIEDPRYKERIKLKFVKKNKTNIVSTEIMNQMDLQEPSHFFIVSSQNAFRFEYNPKLHQGFYSFNDKKMKTKLSALFDYFFNDKNGFAE